MANKTADWTIMVYIAADSVLANFAVESLKQLKRGAGAKVVVAAQVDLDGRADGRKIQRYIFDGSGDPEGSVKKGIEELEPKTNRMTEAKTLTEFINWAYGREECKSTHHCLVLWGHGPCLLEDADVRAAEMVHASKREESVHASKRGKDETKLLYMTPVALRKALEDAQFGPTRKLDIIGIDACSMAMIEIVRELQDYTHFVVASQEEVPDASFPYERMLPIFKETPGDVFTICRTGAEDYKQAYADYVFGESTGFKKCTISCMRTSQTDTVVEPLSVLAQALLHAADKKELREIILCARGESKAFVGGVYVDLYEFCGKLLQRLGSETVHTQLASTCRQIREALGVSKDDFVVANESLDSDCHGLSIYFPYLTDKEKVDIERTPVKGIIDWPIKGIIDWPIKNGIDVATTLRKEAIEETERRFYPQLKLSDDTGWYEFIRHGWSRILAEVQPQEIDIRYSGQQCALNLLNLYQSSKKDKLEPESVESHGAVA